MSISKEQAVKDLQISDNLFVAYSQATRQPYVVCAEDTYNDQVWIFSREEEIRDFGKKKLEEDKTLLIGMKYEKKDFPKLYGTLYAVGVNSIVWNKGDEQIEVDLSDVAKQRDLSSIEAAKRPLMNPTLQLCGMYFMQELRRPVEKDQHKNLREMEEEVLANLLKSEFLVPMQLDAKDPKKMNMPYLKDKNGRILQPFFSDIMEFQKFVRNQKVQVAKVPFLKAQDLLMPQANGIVINPLGFNLVMDREMLKRILGTKVKE